MQTETGRERAGTGRLALVSGLLADALASLQLAGRPAAVLDCGGGTGAYAVPLAVGGAEVTVVDISADALATLERRAAEAGALSRVWAVAGDVESLTDVLVAAREHARPAPGRDEGFDLVLAHGILDVVDDVESTLRAMADAARPGGLLSILVANPYAGVLARALAGEPGAALAELRALGGPGRVGPDSVTASCAALGLRVEARHGVGVFSDLVPGAALDVPGAREAVRQLDAEAAAHTPFAELAGRIHLLVRRPRD